MSCTCPRTDGYRVRKFSCPVHGDEDMRVANRGDGVTLLAEKADNAWSKLEMEHVGGCNTRCDGDSHYLLASDVRHEHDAGGCYECPCIAQPWSASAPCLCNEIAAHVAAALSEHRRDWASWLESWSGAVGTKPPTPEAVVSRLRSDHLPFGVSANTEASA